MPPQTTPEPGTIVTYNFRDVLIDPDGPVDGPTKPTWRPAIIVSRNTDGSINCMVFMNLYEDDGIEDDEGHWWPGVLPRSKATYGTAPGQWRELGDINWDDFDYDPADVPDLPPTPFSGM